MYFGTEDYRIVKYKLDGEEIERTFVFMPRGGLTDFTDLVKGFDEDEGTSYSDRLEIISQEWVTSQFVENPMRKGRFRVGIPIRAYYNIYFEAEVPKYGKESDFWYDIRASGHNILRDTIAENNLDPYKLHRVEVDTDRAVSVADYIVRELEMDEDDDDAE